MKNPDIYINTEVAARLEGVSLRAIQKRIQKGIYPPQSLKRESLERGHFTYKIHLSALSPNAQIALLQEDVQETVSEQEFKERKKRSDAGTTKCDEKLLFRAAAIITTARASSLGQVTGDKQYGYNKGYKFFKEVCEEENLPVVSYRRFIDLVKGWVDKEVQLKENLGTVNYKNKRQMTLQCDYSVYEPMQFLQNDHTQFDVLCMHDGKVLRPWASFHVSVGDRILSYPTIVERPDSYSLADNLVNFVFRYGLSQRPVIYKSDNGKAQKSRLMTNEGNFEDIELSKFDLEERHERALRLMNIGMSHEKGLIQNLGMVESHSQARMPRTKLIERQFGIGGTMEWFTDRKEYTGRKYEEKPEALYKIMKKGDIWSSEEMVEYVISQIDKYNARFHQGIKSEASGRFAVPHIYSLDVKDFQDNLLYLKFAGGLIPESMHDVVSLFNNAEWAKTELKCELYSPLWRRRCFEICGFSSRALPGRETLAMLAMTSIERTVHSYGIVINNNPYMSLKLNPYRNRKVIVRYSPDNIVRIREQSGKEKLFIKEIYVFEKSENAREEKFITIAQPHPHVVMGISPQGYAKTFLTERSVEMNTISKAQKITNQIAQQKEEEKEQTTRLNLIQLTPIREKAALDLKKAREDKQQKEMLKEMEDQDLEQELSQLYGKPVKIGR
jgi:hypothetical protein